MKKMKKIRKIKHIPTQWEVNKMKRFLENQLLPWMKAWKKYADSEGIEWNTFKFSGKITKK